MLYPEPQFILDAVCSRVGNQIYPMFVGWSIGQREAVASIIAEWLGMTDATIDEAVATLIEKDLLTNQPITPDWYSGQDEEHLGITHQGWQKWSGFDEDYLEEVNLDSMDDWLAMERFPEDEYPFPEVFTIKRKTKTPPRTHRSITEPWSPSQK